MKNKDTVKGQVLDTYAGSRYLIRLESGEEVKAYLCGRMKKARVRVSIGDNVEIVLDPAKGNCTNRVVWRA